MFKKAIKSRSKLRMAIIGPSGSGKTYTALVVAKGLASSPSKIAVLDTEHGSASKYSDIFDFDVSELDSFSPEKYVEAIKKAVSLGYEVLIIDSLSHAWIGKDGALELVDRASARSKSGNSFAAWREVTPHHNSMVEAIVTAQIHIICTMRSKTEYVQERDEKTGRTVIRKVGLAPVQRDGLEYEFDIVADMDHDHRLVVTKSRIPTISDLVVSKPDLAFVTPIRQWLSGPEPISVMPDMPVSELESAVNDFSTAFNAKVVVMKASTSQLNEIKRLADNIGVSGNYWNGVKQRFNIGSSANMTEAQANELITELNGLQ